MTKKTYWHTGNTPVETTLDRILYDIRKDDKEGLIFDSISIHDIIEDSDGVIALDALITPYAKLEVKMSSLQKVMERSGTDIKPVNLTISEPFMRNGVANVAAVFELSDGQGVTIFFHNPDVTPKKITATDELISYAWRLNKRDITIVVAPEKGVDLNIRQVAVRIMKLAQKNSAAFLRVNAKSAERKQVIDDLKTEISDLENELKQAQNNLEVAKVEKDEREIAAVANPVTDPEIIDPTPEPTPIEIEPTLNGFSVAETINELNTDYGTNNDVWNATVSEVQALSDSDYEQLIDALENSNYYNQYYAVQALRKGDAELAGEFGVLIKDQANAGQLTPELRIRREELVAKLDGELTPIAETNPLQGHIDTLQSVIDGKHDDVDLTELLDMIDAAATAIIDAGSADEYDTLIGDAATKWADLDEKKNG